ncbi:hypothetical protein D3C81_1085550 [compost metagenome]
MKRWQVAFTDTEASTHGRHVEQIEHFADREAAVWQLEQVLQGNQQWLATALALIGEGKRNVAQIVALQLAEHGADMGRISVDGREHHDHIARAKGRVGAEAGQ